MCRKGGTDVESSSIWIVYNERVSGTLWSNVGLSLSIHSRDDIV